MSYRQVSKGIKHAEVDKAVYYFCVFLSIVFGVIVGAFTKWWIGLIVFFVLLIAFARKYLQSDDKD